MEQIDFFWIVLAVALYAFLVFFIFVAQRRISNLKAHLVDALHKKAEIGNFLSLFSKNLSGMSDMDGAMSRVARYVADLIGAKALCVFTLDEEGHLVAKGVYGSFPPMHYASQHVLTKPVHLMAALKSEKIKIGDGIVGEVAFTGEGVLIDDATEDPRLSNAPLLVETFMAVPMRREGRVAGVICAVNNIHHDAPFAPEQFSALRFMSDQVVLADNILRVYASLSEQQRIGQELEFARQLQASMTPDFAPPWAPFDIFASTTPAKEVSGDFYDFIEVDEDRLLVVIGDSCGKGIPACMLMATARSFIRASAERFTTLREMARDLNNDLFLDTGDERFVTVALCLLDRRSKTVEFVRAGHTELLVKRSGHPVRAICPDGAALGLLPPEVVGDFDILSFSFLDDMSILLFSDGITEALNARGEEYGLEALTDVFREFTEGTRSPEALADAVQEAVDNFAGDEPRADDQTIVVISHA
jgi:serine phosphatase RsbU (regulator of sigma subunit)